MVEPEASNGVRFSTFFSSPRRTVRPSRALGFCTGARASHAHVIRITFQNDWIAKFNRQLSYDLQHATTQLSIHESC